eukprot:TRINITY_DN1888_c0_g1_i1.p1 TRINITY_DN1888_c0_g1~~TRINITY_DN1888_c0_g1_i1.p1  ORF type:complete len:85 (-),score=9.27 TRINITY_DN1888_c0_g1_i1:50-304(-)
MCGDPFMKLKQFLDMDPKKEFDTTGQHSVSLRAGAQRHERYKPPIAPSNTQYQALNDGFTPAPSNTFRDRHRAILSHTGTQQYL